ncbi:MAG: stringent starvation protein B [Phycisphaerales bacterium]|nr:stringent starvation protein B [Hyphomonadaceae bacterium]
MLIISRPVDEQLTGRNEPVRVAPRAKEGAAVADDQIGYESLMQDALRGVVRAALQEAANPRGLPGKHHFYITFRTHAPGVIIPEQLRARYPDEMTIVLEHQFWDLEVYADRFRVILKFSGQPQPITIPLKAITRFFDPSVKFGLQFEQQHQVDEARMASGDDAGGPAPREIATEAPPAPSSDNGVVSLDAFRKK